MKQKLNIVSFSHSGIGRLIISGEFEYPRGVATTKDDYILVLDSELGRVTIHSPSDGQILKTIKGMFMHMRGSGFNYELIVFVSLATAFILGTRRNYQKLNIYNSRGWCKSQRQLVSFLLVERIVLYWRLMCFW